MTKENGFDLVSLLVDENFIQRIIETLGKDNQLSILEKEFPAQRETITYAIEFLKISLADQKIMPSNDVAMIRQYIMAYSIQNRRTWLHRFLSSDLLKVAAILVLILVTSVLTYHYLKDTPRVNFAAIEKVVEDEAMIILSDGSTHILSTNDSKIEYSADGKKIIIKDARYEESFENKNSSKAEIINQIIVPFGHRHSLTLSDGTHVLLNAGSRLIFPAEFKAKNREVFLKGEGYFDVEKDPNHPFIVKTNFLDIKVLGTVFNISAYEDEQVSTAVLVEGSVVVSQINKSSGITENKLKPGQACFYSATTHNSDIQDVEVYNYISWKDGVLQFKDKSLNQIVSRLEKYYNKKIIIQEENLTNTLISGKLVLSDNLDEVMLSLSKTLETRYETDKDGVFTIRN